MSVTLVRQRVKADSIEQAQAGVKEFFAALGRARPGGLRYASTKVADSPEFVILFELAEGAADPRQSMPEFQLFAEKLKGWVDGPPVIETLDVVGSYNLFS